MVTTLNFEVLFNASPNPYVLLDPELTIVGANEAYLDVTGRSRDEILGRNIFDAFPGNPDDPDDSPVRQLCASFERVLEEGKKDTIAVIHYPIPKETEDGVVYEDRYWSATHTPIFNEEGEITLILQHTVDVTELHELRETVREVEDSHSEAVPSAQKEEGVLRRAQAVQETNLRLDDQVRHLQQLFEQAPGFMCFQRGQEHVYELANQAYYQVTGHRDLIGKTVREALPEVEGQGFFELLDRVYETGEPFVGREMDIDIQRKPGGELETIHVDFVYQPIVEPDGSVSGIFTQGYEVTEQKRAKDELRRYKEHLEDLVEERTRELRESQAQLRQAQKMEAVGKLTGGVAHDFNNLLQVIGGNLQLLEAMLPGDEKARRRLRTAQDAVKRGAKLATQLLAFGRQQPLEPRVINPGRLVRSMDDMLRRTLGETIEVETVISGGLWNAFVDPHQLENVILNLAINARDAMDGEGKLTIEAGNAMLDDRYAQQHADVEPGQYVLLAMSDTGEGMSAGVMERAFDPFYTTKPEGTGTGLGLSMAYGFIKQSGGHIKLYSEEGEGTTVKIYLPRTLQEVKEQAEVLSGPVEGGSETILVVEDAPDVRMTVVEMLSELGYRVLKASDGESALAILQSGMHIDLLFTDVVMPGPVRSPDLARQAKNILPDIEVLFTSGYTENAIVHGGRLDPDVVMLSKPYSKEDLARKIRQLLGPGEYLEEVSTDREPEQSEDEDPSASEEARPTLHILLVEDDESVMHFVTEAVKELGYSVVAVASAEEALETFELQAFDVLFTDVTMPGMSGMELAQELKRQQPELHVIIASGHGADLDVEPGDEIPDAITLPKPYDLDQIEELLGQIGRVGDSTS